LPVIRPPALWSTLVATAGLLRHAHAGLSDPTALPRIERSLSAATLDPAWLCSYNDCIGLTGEARDALAPLALQIAAAPLHLSILADARFPFRALGLVHMSQSLTQTQAIPATACLDLLAYCTEARWEKRGMSFCLVTEARCDGQLVWQGRTQALAPSTTPGQPPAATIRRNDEIDPSQAATLLCERTLHVPESCGRRYAAIAGDLNPIHQHALLARLFGFRRAIVHGTWTLARALAVAELPRSMPFSLEARFRRPVSLPSDVIVRAWAGHGEQRRTAEVSSPDGATTYLNVELTESAAVT
jgi:acyl dehydratase